MDIGKELLKAIDSVDLNHDGIPDVKQIVTPAGVLLLAHLAAKGIIAFPTKHDTIAKKLSRKYEAGYSPGG